MARVRAEAASSLAWFRSSVRAASTRAVSRSARVASWPPVGCLTGYWTWAGSSMSENVCGPDLKVWSTFWPLMVPVKWKL
jgi:hypothetical protein